MDQTLRELTEKLVKSEEALKLSEVQFATAFKLSPYAITITTKDGQFIKTNDAFYEMSGFSQDNREDTSLGLWVDVKQREAVIKELFQRGKVLLKEVRFKRKDGTIIESLFSASLMIISHNTEQYILSIISDVTEQKRKAEELKISEEKYRTLIENMNEGVWSIDADANTTFINDKMAEMLGYTREEMLGKPLFNFMDEDSIKLANENVERRKQGIKEHHNFTFRKKNGDKIYTCLNTSPLFIDDVYGGAVATITDIDKQAKEAAALLLTAAKSKADELKLLAEEVARNLVLQSMDVKLDKIDEKVLIFEVKIQNGKIMEKIKNKANGKEIEGEIFEKQKDK